ncbi:HAAS domain-containing protein [Bacillus massiliglaciei]|uniref:HAAS domain-containing protein n=1 Tax=Bacillus massiliglaciei TaxID=1816693 RepID=UPI000DA600D6|nr:hypothetical protein [Bacillus massiliglaciei]
MNLSKESKNFLENLRLYLVSSGKKEQEIEEIIEELEDHLLEAEKNGKSTESISGKTPKEYMSQLADDMPLDLKGLMKYIPILFLGAFAYLLAGDALRGDMSYSLLKLAGFPLIFLFHLLFTAVSFKYMASHTLSKIQEWILFGIIGTVPIVLFIALLFADKAYETPAFHFGKTGTGTAAVLSILIFIGLAIWAKMWMPIVLPAVLYVPELIIDATPLQESVKLMVTALLVPLCAAGCLILFWNKEKKKGAIAEK